MTLLHASPARKRENFLTTSDDTNIYFNDRGDGQPIVFRHGLAVRDAFWPQSMLAGFAASYFCIKVFSETDLTQDLAKIDVPTRVLHGDDDQIVPIRDSAYLSAKLIKNATLKKQIKEELLAFAKS